MTIVWNEVNIWWNEVTKGWNEVVWNEVVMERSDRIPGEFVRSSQIHEELIRRTAGMTVTRDGRIALLLQPIDNTCKVLVSI